MFIMYVCTCMYVCSNTYVSIGKLNVCLLMAYNSNALPPGPWIVPVIPHLYLSATFHSKTEKPGSHNLPSIYLIVISGIHIVSSELLTYTPVGNTLSTGVPYLRTSL